MAIPNDSNDPKRYYRTLEIKDTSASPDDIRKAYRRLARENHPDTVGGELARIVADVKNILKAHGIAEKDREEFGKKLSNLNGNVDEILDTWFKIPDGQPAANTEPAAQEERLAITAGPGDAKAPEDEDIIHGSVDGNTGIRFSAKKKAEIKSSVLAAVRKIKSSEERFKEMTWAYEVLSDTEKRQMYDAGDFGAGRGTGGGRGTAGWFSEDWFNEKKREEIQDIIDHTPPGQKPDLSAVLISFYDLSGMDLAGAKFGSFYGTKFTGCNLKDADFSDCHITSGKFYGADLTGADFSGATLYFCDFRHLEGQRDTILRNANFTGAKINHTFFDFADLKGTKFQDAKFNNSPVQADALDEQQKHDIRAGGGGTSIRGDTADISTGMAVAAAAFAAGSVAVGAVMYKKNKKELAEAKAKGEEPARKLTFGKVASVTLLTMLSLTTVALAAGAFAGRGEKWSDRMSTGLGKDY